MITLAQLLSIFTTVTIQRSRSYLNQINLDSLDISHDADCMEIYAQVEGTDQYDTFIVYDPKRQRVIETECSCPAGSECKHAAALTQLFYQKYLSQPNALNTLNPVATSSNQEEQRALFWLNEFQNTLKKIDTPLANEQEKLGQLIYVLQQNPQLTCKIFKVRRNKSGEITDTKAYNNYGNIIYNKIAMPESEQHLFQKIYTYSTINHSGYYDQSKLILQDIPRNDFKDLIQSQYCHWHDDKVQPLQWSDESYQLELQWQRSTRSQDEKLVIYLISPHADRIALNTSNILNQTHDFEIVYTQPLSLIQRQHRTIHHLETAYASVLIQQILSMPVIPKHLMTKVDQILQQHKITQTIPKSKSNQDIRHLHGHPVAILRFGGFRQLTTMMLNSHHQGLAEVHFEYLGGKVKANTSDDHFFGKENNEIVYQHRDLIQEQKYFQQLQQLVPSLQWVTQHHALSHLKQQQNALICADYHELVNNLIPTNTIENLGWKIEHLPDSQFHLQHAQNIKLSLTESETQKDWFKVGASVQDNSGKQYDLIELLAQLIQRHPFLLEPSVLNEMDDHRIFTIELGHDQPHLALNIKSIKPILQNLGSILQQDHHEIDRYDASQLLELQHHLGMPWLVNDHLKQFAERLKEGIEQQLPTPKGFQGELRPYQQQGLGWLQFLVHTEHGGILADDMGLGKTAQTLAHLLMQKHAGHLQGTPALIIAPTSLMHNWYKEAEKFTPELKVLILQGPQRHQYFSQIPNHDIILSTYPLLARDEQLLLNYEFHQLILDEAQNIKNPNAKAAQVVRQLNAQHRLCLTGTPMENHLGELWSLFYFLMPGFLSSQALFNKNYRYPIEKQADQLRQEKLVNRIKPFILRRLKTDVAKELPPKTTIEINIDMNEQQSKLYEAVRASMQENIRQIIAQKGFKRSQIQILDALLKLRQVCCHPSLVKIEHLKTSQAHSAKLDQLIDMVCTMVEQGRKILIFSQFTSMLQLIEDSLNIHHIKHVKLTGQTRKREDAITAFQSGIVPVFLISLKAGGVGLNLTAADTVIHYDPWWNPAAEDQASDRAWRIGQDKPVFVYKLITNQSIEEKILALQKNKAQLSQSILSIDHEDEIKLNETDIMTLFDKF